MRKECERESERQKGYYNNNKKGSIKKKKKIFFFFKQKTAYEIGTGDWSSDVCSSDLNPHIDLLQIHL